LPLKDIERRGNKKTYGVLNSDYIGFMDDGAPVRVDPKDAVRFKGSLNCVWFRLDNDFKSVNKTRIINGPTDKYGYSAYDLDSAQKTFSWFAITKVFNGVYPLWANQLDLWKPNVRPGQEAKFYSLCFAFGLANNGCVVTKFEKNDPIPGNNEIFVHNPLCPTDEDSFWSRIMASQVVGEDAVALVSSVKKLYKGWRKQFADTNIIENIGLEKEAYFKFFSYPDFVTPFSGLIQIKKYVDLHGVPELAACFEEIDACKRKVKSEIYEMLVNDMRYFG
jgi:hypothetical protein